VRVRVYLPEAQIGKEIAITEEQVRHLKVLRLKEGEKIGIFDGKGHEYEGVYSAKVREGKIVPETEAKPQEEPKTNITLATAVPKGARMDVLVEKVSEIGVTNIVPIISKRSIVEPRENKVERWRKIAIEASCQSGRSIVPTISEPVKFKELLHTIKQYNKAILCHKTGKPLTETYEQCDNIIIIVGPEGDFTPEEIEQAKTAGCIAASLGPTILRTETAGITAAAQVIALSQKVYK